jgi:glutamate racemase
MHANGPIGLFDSGVGGLTVASALAKALPRESLLYFGDTEHLPYGDKSPEAIRGFSLKIARHLVDQGAKAIVIACNSASAVAFDHLQAHLNVPVFNVIDPVIAAIEASGSKNIAVGDSGHHRFWHLQPTHRSSFATSHHPCHGNALAGARD